MSGLEERGPGLKRMPLTTHGEEGQSVLTHTPRPFSGNLLLKAMSESDLALLSPHFVYQTIPLRTYLERPGILIETIFFIDQGIASVVAVAGPDTEIEVGLIGREGVSGVAVILCGDRSPHICYMQIAGGGFAIKANALLSAMAKSPTLANVLLRYAQAFGIQTAQTALSNGKANVIARLARWILMAEDRVTPNPIALTHELLSIMLGIRRPGVTEAIQTLVTARLISARRGELMVVNRAKLQALAKPFYGSSEREYKRIFC